MAFKYFIFLVSLGFVASLPEPVPDVQVNVNVNVNGGGSGPEKDDSCVFGFRTYEEGAIIEDVCMVLQCMDGNWKYLEKIRQGCGNCTVWGDPHFYIFDNHTGGSEGGNYYRYLGDGDFTIIQNGLENQNQTEFGVDSKFVPCPFGDDVSCVKSVTYYEPGITVFMTIPEPDRSCMGDNDPQCAIKVYVNNAIRNIGSSVEEFYATDGTLIVFRHNHVVSSDSNLNCMNVVGSKGLSVSFCSHQGDYAFFYVFAIPSLKSDMSQLYGLCGTYTGNTQDGYTLRNGSTTQDTNAFAENWEIPTTGSIIVAKRTVSVNKCLDTTVLLAITAQCQQMTEEACAVTSSPWCLSMKGACIFDLCRMPNHDNYAAGYVSHMAIHTHLITTMVGSRWGCVLATTACAATCIAGPECAPIVAACIAAACS